MKSETNMIGDGAAILARVIELKTPNLSPEAARSWLALEFDEQDKARMHDLAARNQEDALSDAEKRELKNYVGAGHILGLLHSKARRALTTREGS